MGTGISSQKGDFVRPQTSQDETRGFRDFISSFNALEIILIALGTALRLFQYLVNSSLWGDELSLLLGICSTSPLNLLTHPLPSSQMAPTGFLLATKAVIAVAGMSEFSFRFIPFVSSVLTLPVLAILSRKLLSSPARLLPLCAVAVCPPLIRHAAQAKPYSSDVVICLVLLLAACSWMESDSRRSAIRLGVIGALAVWFSYTALFVVATIALVAIARWVREPRKWDFAIPTMLTGWLASTGAMLLVEKHRASNETHSFMVSFWADWLMPHEKTLRTVYAYLVRIVRDFSSALLHLPLWLAFVVIAAVGVLYLARRIENAILIAGPIALALIASMMGVYPFSGRLILFLIPSVFLLVAAGCEAFAESLRRFKGLPELGISILWLASFFLCLWPLRRAHPPFRDSETRPMIAYLAQHIQSGDAVYVHNMAWFQYGFYAPKLGLHPNEVSTTENVLTIGPKPKAIMSDVEKFRGRPRLWILFGGGYPVEQTCTVAFLDAIAKREDYKSALNADLYLYDLSSSPSNTISSSDFFAQRRSTPACSYTTEGAIAAQP